MKKILISIFFFLSFLSLTFSSVKLPSVISDNMVLQQNKEVKVWGWAKAGEKVEVKIGNLVLNTEADKDGKWVVKFNGFPAGKVYKITIRGENNKVEVKNIIFGEVYLASGQSNMEFRLRGDKFSKEEIPEANFSEIRFFDVKNKTATEPLSDVEGKWVICSPETAGRFPAVAYYFAKNIHKKLNVPVGIIESDWGGTPVEAWMSPEVLKKTGEFENFKKQWEKILKNWTPEKEKKYREDRRKWWKERKKAIKEGRKIPPRPKTVIGPLSPHRPSNLYNGMIHPLTNYTIRGVIWYQGESNAGRPLLYRKLFPAMIVDWREKWEYQFPFLFVQLPNYLKKQSSPEEKSNWALLRESQLYTLKTVPETGMAITIDLGEENNIHPKNKRDVGYRLSLIALAKIYGEKIEYSGPIYKNMKIEGNKIRIYFEHTDGGLFANGGKLKGFVIAGEDKKFKWADAKIEENTVIVWNEEVKNPVAVRYDWANNPPGNLYNKAGLPASPFRTDNW